MSLRCSLLGHEYGESEIERDREERGDEVVLSVTELERCSRCGNARTISENTEVTQRSPRGEATAADAPEPPEPTAEPETGDAIARTSDAGTEPDSSLGGAPSADLDGDADDAEILDAEGSDDRPRRESGAWPEYDDEPATTGASTAWPSVEGEDEGFDASVPDGEPPDVEFGGGLTPQSADHGAEIMEASSSGDEGGADVEFVRSEAPTALDRPVEIEGETEIYCPNCDASDLDERDSLRAGDICPDCRRGYLAERER